MAHLTQRDLRLSLPFPPNSVGDIAMVPGLADPSLAKASKVPENCYGHDLEHDLDSVPVPRRSPATLLLAKLLPFPSACLPCALTATFPVLLAPPLTSSFWPPPSQLEYLAAEAAAPWNSL